MGEGIQKDSRDFSVHSYCSEQNPDPHLTVNSEGTITASTPSATPKDQELSRFERKKRELLSDPYFCSWSEKQVSEFLLKRLHDLSCYHQIPHRSSEISFSRRMWGRCFSNGHIIINFNVAVLPERLRDYVFLHELVHTRVMSHADDFWLELNKYTAGKARELKQELNCYQMKVTTP